MSTGTNLATNTVKPATGPESSTGDDRRRDGRTQLRAVIRVAEWDGEHFPAPEEFRNVETRDLATNGVSFFDVQPPSAEKLILQMGGSETPIYVLARVAHSQECLWSKDRQSFIGCEFLERVQR